MILSIILLSIVIIASIIHMTYWTIITIKQLKKEWKNEKQKQR